jgi:uncharacterized Tic20 family protein
MNDLIPFKIRLLAAGIYAVFAVPMGSFLLFVMFFMISEINPTNHNLFGLIAIDFLFGLPMTIILPVAILIVWNITRKIHPFVDLAGKDVLNYSLNSLVSTLIFSFVTCTTYGVVSMINPAAGSIFIVGLIIINGMALAYTINTVIAGIYALRGYRFKNRLIHSFIRNE